MADINDRKLPLDVFGNKQAQHATVLNTNDNSTGSERISKARNDFLGMMMATIKHQTPDNPTDPSQMLNMVTSLTQTEQAIETNNLLKEILNNNRKSSILRASEFQGQKVSFDDSVRNFTDKPVIFHYSLSNAQAKNMPSDAILGANISILDNDNKVVYRKKIENLQYDNEFIWHGVDSKGSKVPQGEYKIRVESYYTSNMSGEGIFVPIESTTNSTSIVQAIESYQDEISLIIENGSKISPDAVTKLWGSEKGNLEYATGLSKSELIPHIGQDASIKLDKLMIKQHQAEIELINNVGTSKKYRVSIFDSSGSMIDSITQNEEITLGDMTRNISFNQHVRDGQYKYQVEIQDENGSYRKLDNIKNIHIGGIDLSEQRIISGNRKYHINDITQIMENTS